jgi:Family of unknown function (DUF6152)
MLRIGRGAIGFAAGKTRGARTALELRSGMQFKKEGAMTQRLAILAALGVLAGPAIAHHGWGSYDAANPVTVAGPILTSKFENPHATITVRAADKVWTVTLAPTSRMTSRGASAAVVAAGKDVSAFGYPSTVEKDEMRAERITVDGKTYEMR